MKMRA